MSTVPRVLVVLGPTASGKSDLAIKIAKMLARPSTGSGDKRSAEIISADSRQVYRGLDIGSGKIPRDKSHRPWAKRYFYRGVRHHLLDVVSPKRTFTVAQYQKLAREAAADILRRGNLPIVCGGTGLYVDASLSDTPFPAVPPDQKLRARLGEKSTAELFTMLRKLDPRRARSVDRHNPRRLVRALEIVMKTGKPVPKEVPRQARDVYVPPERSRAQSRSVAILKIGLRPPDAELKRRIHARLLKWFRQGLIAEVRRLREKNGVPWKRFEELGLEYRLVARYLRGTIAKTDLVPAIERALWQYVRRQMTWWKRDPAIHWVLNEREALVVAKRFYSSR